MAVGEGFIYIIALKCGLKKGGKGAVSGENSLKRKRQLFVTGSAALSSVVTVAGVRSEPLSTGQAVSRPQDSVL